MAKRLKVTVTVEDDILDRLRDCTARQRANREAIEHGEEAIRASLAQAGRVNTTKRRPSASNRTSPSFARSSSIAFSVTEFHSGLEDDFLLPRSNHARSSTSQPPVICA